MKYFNIGGVEVVSNYLANSFVKEGFNVHIVSINKADSAMVNRLSKDVAFYQLDGTIFRKCSSLRKYIADNNIDVIINQWGLPFYTSFLCWYAKGKSRVISFYHNDPTNVAFVRRFQDKKKQCNNFVGFIYSILIILLKISVKFGFRTAYQISDKYMLLSKSYLKSFCECYSISEDSSRLGVITNPVTIESDYNPSLISKRKEIVFVGRLDENQKRVSRVLDVWNLLWKKFPDWKLIVVGDGPEKDGCLKKSQSLSLQNIDFVGFKNPLSYYETASLLILTSEYEGFPLVLAESMSYGVVPVVYGSFSAASDIVCNGENGFIIEQNNQFDSKKMANSFALLMDDSIKLRAFSENALKASESYKIEFIQQIWNRELHGLTQANS